MIDKKPRVLVTGASRGIGLAIFKQLAANGFEPIGTATSEASIPDGLETSKWIVADFRSSDGMEGFLSEVQALGPLNGLVNNAGINYIIPMKDVSPKNYDDLLMVDLKMPFFISQRVAQFMDPGGRIVNIASLWSLITRSKRTLYTTAKTGMVGMTRAMAAELGPRGILVNSVSPGFTKTELTDASLSEAEKKELCNQIPLGRMAETEEIARLVCFLVGPDNTYITGQNIIIDGGFSIV